MFSASSVLYSVTTVIQKDSRFVNEPFQAWNKMKEKAKDHEHSSYHQLSVKIA